MLDTVLDSMVDALKAGGIDAFREYPNMGAVLSSGVFVCVGAESCKALSPGFGDYLGIKTDPISGELKELYGKRLELIISFEVFSPFGEAFGADACVGCADKLSALLCSLPSGLSCIELNRGEVSADNELSVFRCLCSLRCLAFFLAEKSENDAEFLDFILKGALGSANK